jgi:alkylation response protein AidB-like acyl-CoA dehydrogenase
MELILSDEQRLLADSAGKLFARLGGVKRARDLRDREAGFDREALRAMADNGWLGMLVAENCGGQQLGPTELALVLEQAGRALAPEPISQMMLAALMISESGDAAVREQLLPAAIGGRSLIVPALQEQSAGIDAADIETRLERAAGGWRLNGRKGFVLGATACDGFLVSARDAEGLTICHVPRAAPGLDIQLAPTVDGRAYGELTFRNVATSEIIARANTAAAILQRHHGLALVAAAAEMLGLMEAISERTVDYMKTRKQFGRAIGSFQALQHRAVDNYVLIESTRSLLHQICEGGEPLAAAMVSALKAQASSAALTVTKSAIQLHGAIGFTDEHDAGLYLKRAMWLSAYLGNAAFHQQRYAALSA